MSIEEIDAGSEGVYGVALEDENPPLDLHQNNVLEQVDRVAHTAFEHMQQWSLQGLTSPFTWAFLSEGLLNNNPITYTAGKACSFVVGTIGFLPSTILRAAYAPIHWMINVFQSNEFFYFQGQRREFKEQLETFAHWDVELYSSYRPLSGQLPFNERAIPIVEHIKEVSPDICFLSHVNSASANWLFEGLKGEYADFFVDIGKKGGWSFNGGLFVASKVALSTPPTFYRVQLGKEFNYKGGFFVIETAEQLFVVTDLVHGNCPLVQDLRAAAMEKIIQFLKAEHDTRPIEKTILVTGDLAFGGELEIQRLHDRFLEDEQVKIVSEQGALRIALEPASHAVFEVSKQSELDSYAASHPFEQFELTRAPKVEERTDEVIEKEGVLQEEQPPVIQDKVHEEITTSTGPVYIREERGYEATGEGLDGEMPYHDAAFTARGELIPEVNMGQRIFEGHGMKTAEEIKIAGRRFEASGQRLQPDPKVAPNLFEGRGSHLQQEPTLKPQAFTGKGVSPQVVLPAHKRQFVGSGAEIATGATPVDRLYESRGKQQDDLEVEETLFNGQAVRGEEAKQVQERFFEGTGDAIKKIKEEQVDILDTGIRVDDEKEVDEVSEVPTVDEDGVVDEIHLDKEEVIEQSPIEDPIEIEEPIEDIPEEVHEEVTVDDTPINEEVIIEDREEVPPPIKEEESVPPVDTPQTEPPRRVIDRVFR